MRRSRETVNGRLHKHIFTPRTPKVKEPDFLASRCYSNAARLHIRPKSEFADP